MMRAHAARAPLVVTPVTAAPRRASAVRAIIRAPMVQRKLATEATNSSLTPATTAVRQEARSPLLQRQAGDTGGEPDHIDSIGGICLKSIFGGEVMFVGLSTSELAGLAVINEDAGAGLTRPPVNNVWYDCDGFWQQGHSQWFKIPDHCAVEVSGLDPLAYDRCCNIAASLLKDGPRWSSDTLDPSKTNPFR